MLLSRKILKTLPKRRLLAVAEKLSFSGITSLSKNKIIGKISTNRHPKEILKFLKLYEIKPVCSDLDLDLSGIGRRQEFIKLILRTERKSRSKRIKAKKIKPKKRQVPKRSERQRAKPIKPSVPIQQARIRSKKESAMAQNNNGIAELEKRLWAAADQLRANSSLTAQQYSRPVLGLIFLKYADQRFSEAEKQLANQASGRRREVGKLDYQSKGVLYLPEKARFSNLIKLPEGADIGKAMNQAMDLTESENEDLKGVLPRTYTRIESPLLFELLKLFNSIPMDIEGDVFGRIYEYFLGKFAMSEGRGGGEFFTPTSIVKLIVNIIEPFNGRIYDPACGSGGMFVQSAKFVQEHRKNPSTDIMVFGQESKGDNINIGKMNLGVHGLSGDIKLGNTYYEDFHNGLGKFDYVMANPPFNVNGVDKERIKDDRRYPFGIPRTDNANYLWIQAFYSALNDKGRAGFVMANSAADARQSELEIRKKLVQTGHVDVVVAVSTNFFYSVTLPVTLWFFDKRKPKERMDKVLFMDARNVYNQIDRAHRDFRPEQLEFLSNIVRLYRKEDTETQHGSDDLLKAYFSKSKYQDIKGLCKVATLTEIEAQGWSLNPGRYVGVAEVGEDDEECKLRLQELNEELDILNNEARDLEDRISSNISLLLEKI